MQLEHCCTVIFKNYSRQLQTLLKTLEYEICMSEMTERINHCQTGTRREYIGRGSSFQTLETSQLKTSIFFVQLFTLNKHSRHLWNVKCSKNGLCHVKGTFGHHSLCRLRSVPIRYWKHLYISNSLHSKKYKCHWSNECQFFFNWIDSLFFSTNIKWWNYLEIACEEMGY